MKHSRLSQASSLTERLLDVHEAAAMLALKPATLYQWAYERRIPVVVLTSSQSDDDVLSVYNLQANCYVPKPADLERFLTVIRAIEHFWFTTARLPGA